MTKQQLLAQKLMAKGYSASKSNMLAAVIYGNYNEVAPLLDADMRSYFEEIWYDDAQLFEHYPPEMEKELFDMHGQVVDMVVSQISIGGGRTDILLESLIRFHPGYTQFGHRAVIYWDFTVAKWLVTVYPPEHLTATFHEAYPNLEDALEIARMLCKRPPLSDEEMDVAWKAFDAIEPLTNRKPTEAQLREFARDATDAMQGIHGNPLEVEFGILYPGLLDLISEVEQTSDLN